MSMEQLMLKSSAYLTFGLLIAFISGCGQSPQSSEPIKHIEVDKSCFISEMQCTDGVTIKANEQCVFDCTGHEHSVFIGKKSE